MKKILTTLFLLAVATNVYASDSSQVIFPAYKEDAIIACQADDYSPTHCIYHGDSLTASEYISQLGYRHFVRQGVLVSNGHIFYILEVSK